MVGPSCAGKYSHGLQCDCQIQNTENGSITFFGSTQKAQCSFEARIKEQHKLF